jgi:hypothetical protein
MQSVASLARAVGLALAAGLIYSAIAHSSLDGHAMKNERCFNPQNFGGRRNSIRGVSVGNLLCAFV